MGRAAVAARQYYSVNRLYRFPEYPATESASGRRHFEPRCARAGAAFTRLGVERRAGEVAAPVSGKLPAEEDAALADGYRTAQGRREFSQEHGRAFRDVEGVSAGAIEGGPHEFVADSTLAIGE